VQSPAAGLPWLTLFWQMGCEATVPCLFPVVHEMDNAELSALSSPELDKRIKRHASRSRDILVISSSARA
jgi:hypothetical protein